MRRVSNLPSATKNPVWTSYGIYVYSERGSNPHGRCWPQDFKSGVSTCSTIRAAAFAGKAWQTYENYRYSPNRAGFYRAAGAEFHVRAGLPAEISSSAAGGGLRPSRRRCRNLRLRNFVDKLFLCRDSVFESGRSLRGTHRQMQASAAGGCGLRVSCETQFFARNFRAASFFKHRSRPRRDGLDTHT